MIGGHTNSSTDKRDSNTAERYDPFTGEWTQVKNLNTPRHRLGVAVLDGMIYALGGSDGMIHLNTMERYDIEKDEWTALPEMSTRRMGMYTLFELDHDLKEPRRFFLIIESLIRKILSYWESAIITNIWTKYVESCFLSP